MRLMFGSRGLVGISRRPGEVPGTQQPAVDVAALPANGTREAMRQVDMAPVQRRLIATLIDASSKQFNSTTVSLRLDGNCG